MAKKKAKMIRLESPCPLCGHEIETVWMKDGSKRAVEPDRRRVIFTNFANADGREMSCWVPHHPCKGKNDGENVL